MRVPHSLLTRSPEGSLSSVKLLTVMKRGRAYPAFSSGQPKVSSMTDTDGSRALIRKASIIRSMLNKVTALK